MLAFFENNIKLITAEKGMRFKSEFLGLHNETKSFLQEIQCWNVRVVYSIYKVTAAVTTALLLWIRIILGLVEALVTN